MPVLHRENSWKTSVRSWRERNRKVHCHYVSKVVKHCTKEKHLSLIFNYKVMWDNISAKELSAFISEQKVRQNHGWEPIWRWDVRQFLSLFLHGAQSVVCWNSCPSPAALLIGGDVQSSACAVPLPNPSITLQASTTPRPALSHTSDHETSESPALPVPYGRPTAAPFMCGWGCRLDSGRMQFPWHCHRAPTAAVAWTPAGWGPADPTGQPDHDALT